MQTPRELSEHRAVHGIAVALLTEDRVLGDSNPFGGDATGTRGFHSRWIPAGPTDAILRQIQDSRAEVVIVDILRATLSELFALSN